MQEDQTSANVLDKGVASTWWNPRNWPVGVWVLLFGFVVLMLPFGIRAVVLFGVPEIAEPFDVVEFCKWDVPAEEDAFTEYRQATRLRDQLMANVDSESMGLPESYKSVVENGWVDADEALVRCLENNAELLNVWRRGTEKFTASRITGNRSHHKDGILDRGRAGIECAHLAAIAGQCDYRNRQAGSVTSEGRWNWNDIDVQSRSDSNIVAGPAKSG